MPFKNRIRLPFYLTRPQFPTEANVFRLANGRRKTLSGIVMKTFEGETDNLPKEIHERLIIALKHDDVTIECKYLATGVSLDGDYEIDWNKFLDYPLAKASFKAQVTPFDYSNDNCQTCEDVSQVVCVDDDLGTINEDDTITVHVLENDSICCSPVIISLVTYNSDYLDSCIISGNDIIIHLKPSLPDTNNVVLVTYRAQCPNGAYDEANVIANINGTDPTPVCLAPSNISNTSVTDTTAGFSWTAPSPAPSCGYHWEVFQGVSLIASGDVSVTSTNVTGLSASTEYTFSVRSNCCSLDSNYGNVVFSTNPPDNTESCGQYQLFYARFFAFYIRVTYLDCNGNQQDVIIHGGETKLICALQSSPGAPVQIIAEDDIEITYIDLC
jgi:hypothetical protein